MSTSKKDYVAIAKIVADLRDDVSISDRALFASALADYFATQSPQFDRERFINACAGLTKKERA